MLIRNPEYQAQDRVENKCRLDEPFVVHTPREMLVGQFALMMFLVIAILLRAMA